VPSEYPTIEEAISAAAEGDTVRIECGTYYEHDLQLKPGVRIEGEDLDDPCVVIDAQDLGRVFMVPGKCGPDTEIVGLILKHGRAWKGGAMCLDSGSSPTITNIEFVHNQGSGQYNRGGALYCTGSSPTLTNAFFSRNSAVYGGAMYCCEGSAPVLIDCDFMWNTAVGRSYGGALYSSESSLRAQGCRFRDGGASFGAGVYCYFGGATSRPVFDGCSFERNEGVWGGGFNGQGVELHGCVFLENGGYAGGGICGHDLLAENCVFRGNHAVLGGGFGIDHHTAGGDRVEATLRGCTMYRNEAGGGGVYAYGADLTIENTVIAGNLISDAIRLDQHHASASLSCCNLFGNSGGDWVHGVQDQLGVNGNKCVDPMFCEPEGELFISASSECAPENSGGCGLIGALGVGCE
jgi:hypothetical protein